LRVTYNSYLMLHLVRRWVVICAWWCIMARKWTRTAGNYKEDSFGLQQGFSTVATVAAWSLPAAHTIAVLVTRDVDADELTGKSHLVPLFYSHFPVLLDIYLNWTSPGGILLKQSNATQPIRFPLQLSIFIRSLRHR